MSCFPRDSIKELEILRESDTEGQQNLIMGLQQDWGKQRFHSWKTQNLVCTKIQGKGAVTPQRPESDIPANPGEPLGGRRQLQLTLGTKTLAAVILRELVDAAAGKCQCGILPPAH